MRNTTKLKVLLIKYTVSLDMNENDSWILLLTEKGTNEMRQFEGKSYSTVLASAYSFLLKELKRKEI